MQLRMDCMLVSLKHGTKILIILVLIGYLVTLIKYAHTTCAFLFFAEILVSMSSVTYQVSFQA